MLSLHLSIPLRSATPREGTVGSDTKAERNGDGKVLGKQCDGDSAPGSLLSPFTSYSFRFFLHHGLVASFCPRLAYSFHSSLNSSLLHTIRSARHEGGV